MEGIESGRDATPLASVQKCKGAKVQRCKSGKVKISGRGGRNKRQGANKGVRHHYFTFWEQMGILGVIRGTAVKRMLSWPLPVS
ncbi:MAG: hypothetical protein EBS00_07080 [Verrucomicrobia bacterium]|nr:hypothetical protein [Verrucomicrobiota bacterium]